ncbi:MAG: GTPase Der [Candidatus Hepatoplasma vulgare]|nr:MAG: GTPase Der [Candidatus Hepatoplasma sp.]
MKSKLPNVVIVGRSNVGKSTLFNKIINKKFSIVHDEEGVTRDRIYYQTNWLNYFFNLIDTGGISKNINLPFQEEINFQIEIALKEADVIIFLVSGKEGLQEGDFFLNKKLRQLKDKKIVLAVNKIDNIEKQIEEYQYEKLGIKDIFMISSIHGHNVDKLLDKIIFYLPKKIEKVDEEINIGIVGKPNVGKSTLLNQLLKEERAIVSSIPGTTRDSFNTKIKYNDKTYILKDTAGIKKNKKSLNDVEWYAELRANLAIIDSDIVLHILDYDQEFTFIDEKILGILKNNLKPTILLINKLDLYKGDNLEKIKKDLKNKMKFSPYLKELFISAKNNKNIDKIFPLIEKIIENSKRKISISKLNDFLFELQLIKKVQNYHGINVKLTYITYVNKNYPHFIIFSNHPDMIHFSYKRFIENQIRKIFDFEGVPIKITFKRKEQ